MILRTVECRFCSGRGLDKHVWGKVCGVCEGTGKIEYLVGGESEMPYDKPLPPTPSKFLCLKPAACDCEVCA